MVASSVPDVVIEFIHWRKCYGSTRVVELTHYLKEMVTKYSSTVGVSGRKADRS